MKKDLDELVVERGLFLLGRIHLNLGYVADFQGLWRVVLPFELIQLPLKCVEEVGHDVEDCGVAYGVGSSEDKHIVRIVQALVMACLILLANAQ